MNKYFSFALAVWVLIVSMAEPLQAEGFYLSTDLGMNFGKSLNMYGHDTDRPSVCDEYINPAFMTVNSTLGWTNTNCTGPNRGSDSVWENDFGSDEGVLFGTALGYYIGDSSFRAELEYFYRNTNYNETSETTVGGGEVLSKLVQEIVRAEERIGHLASHNLFANLYMDFANSSRFTPYVGLGLGTGFAGLQYNGVFARDIDPARITTGNAPEGGQPLANAAQIQANLAGTTTTESEQLTDTLFGYQLMVGVDYALTESLLLGFKGRWVNFESFTDKDDWDQLRSHPSNLRKDGSEPVAYDIRLDDIEMFAVSLNLKYRF